LHSIIKNKFTFHISQLLQQQNVNEKRKMHEGEFNTLRFFINRKQRKKTLIQQLPSHPFNKLF
jgi:hypothetical protein